MPHSGSLLIATIVHHPADARIASRQLPALVEAGFNITYAAPFSSYGVAPPEGVTAIDLPRAQGKNRWAAIRTAQKIIAEHNPTLTLIHDPELLLAVKDRGKAVVWDVHEDVAAAVQMRQWIPQVAKPVARGYVARLQRQAESRHHLILAEHSYQQFFTRPHLVVPNSTVVPTQVPPSGSRRVVYLGSITSERGGAELLQLGKALAQQDILLELYGPAHGQLESLFKAADAAGDLRWYGFTANDKALAAIEGASAGLSLLHDEPNYRHSQPTKLIEYLAHGVPVISTELPVAQEFVQASGGGLTVPFHDVPATESAIRSLVDNPALRAQFAQTGHAYVWQHYNWDVDKVSFVSHIRTLMFELLQ